MKKYLFTLLALSVLTACVRQEPVEKLQTGGEICLKAYFEDAVGETRTTLVDGRKVYWNPKDKILVFTDNYDTAFDNMATETSAIGEFYGTIETASQYRAFYPYSRDLRIRGKQIECRVEPSQVATEGNVTEGYLYSAGISKEDGALAFQNLMSGICFTLEGEGIKEVRLMGYRQEPLAGETLVVYDTPEAAKIRDLLKKHGGNRSETAKELGISTTTLWRYMKKYNVSPSYTTDLD